MRTLTEEVVAAITSRAVRIEYFYEGNFTGGTLRLWTGIGDKELNGQTYLGNGWLLGIGGLKEVLQSQAQGITLSLSGVPVNVVSLILNEASSSVTGSIQIAWLDEDEAIIGSDVLFSGDLDETSIKEGASKSLVAVSYESKLIRLKNKREFRYSDATQQANYPGDKGFEYLAQIKNKRLYWGRPDLTRIA